MISLNPWLIAAISIAVWWAGIEYLDRKGHFPEFIDTYGPFLMLQTERTKTLLDRIANRHPRFWKAWGNAGLGAALLVMLGNIALWIFTAIAVLKSPPEPTAANDPANMLIVPGVNDFIPLSVLFPVIVALTIALVIHEGGHGIYCRLADIDIDSVGVLVLGVIPAGAFVDPDDDQEENAATMDKLRMYAAGVTNNFAMAIFMFVFAFLLIGQLVVVAPGAPVGTVYNGSAAEQAGLSHGDRITAVNGVATPTARAAAQELDATANETVTLTINGDHTITIDRQVYVVAALSDIGIPPKSKVVAVNGKEIHTESDLRNTLLELNTSRATLTTGTGQQVTVPVGVPVHASPNSPAAQSGIPTDTVVFLSHVNGNRVVTQDGLAVALATANGTANVTLTTGSENATIPLSAHNTNGNPLAAVGLSAVEGINGLRTTDIGMTPFPVDTYHDFIRGQFGLNGASLVLQSLLVLALPMAALLGLPFNFHGIAGSSANFFDVVAPLGPIEGVVFFTATTAFWTGWINLHLALFNCIPTVLLDGGHILRSGIGGIVNRVGLGPRDGRLARGLTYSIILVMLSALLVSITVPVLLG